MMTAKTLRTMKPSGEVQRVIRIAGVAALLCLLAPATGILSGCGPMIKPEQGMTFNEANYVVILKKQLKRDGITTSAWDYYIPLRNEFRARQAREELPPEVNDPNKYYDWLKEQEAKQRSSSEEKRQ